MLLLLCPIKSASHINCDYHPKYYARRIIFGLYRDNSLSILCAWVNKRLSIRNSTRFVPLDQHESSRGRTAVTVYGTAAVGKQTLGGSGARGVGIAEVFEAAGNRYGLSSHQTGKTPVSRQPCGSIQPYTAEKPHACHRSPVDLTTPCQMANVGHDFSLRTASRA